MLVPLRLNKAPILKGLFYRFGFSNKVVLGVNLVIIQNTEYLTSRRIVDC